MAWGVKTSLRIHSVPDPFRAGTYNFQLLSTVGGKVVWPRETSDTLPTPMNLSRWKIVSDSKCALCQALKPTTNHVLSGCSIALEQDRYT